MSEYLLLAMITSVVMAFLFIRQPRIVTGMEAIEHQDGVFKFVKAVQPINRDAAWMIDTKETGL